VSRNCAGIRELRFERYESGLSLAWKDDRIISLHAPVIGEIENVVWGANDQRGKVLILHQCPNAVEFRLVNGPGHDFFSVQGKPGFRASF